AWSGDGTVTFRARAVVAALVAGRGNHHNSRSPGSLDSLTEGIERIALVDLAAKRKVDHANVVGRFQADRGLDRPNHAAVGAGAVLIQHTQVNNVCIGCDSFECMRKVEPGGKPPFTRNDSGNVRSVAI